MPRPLGQHFLTDPSILDRIVDALHPDPQDLVIEVGPGTGTLTRRLAPRVGTVVAIEKDRRLATRLQSANDTPPNVVVIEGDAVEVDWMRRVMTHLPPGAAPPSFKVVGNLPYYLTSPLIEKVLVPPRPTVAAYLVQREVADRLQAPPGSKTYGALSVGVQGVARVERLFTVPAGAFKPPPNVDSALVRLTPRPDPLIDEVERPAFRTFVAALFAQRRKQLGRSLRAVAGVSREGAAELLRRARVAPDARVEVLPPPQIVALFRILPR